MATRLRPDNVSRPALPAGAVIRQLTHDDAAIVAQTAQRLGRPEDESYWRSRLAMVTTCAKGVELEGKLIAHLVARLQEGEFGLPGRSAWLELLGVEPGWQGYGLTRALTEALMEDAAREGVERVMTVVNGLDERLPPFFRALGFRQSRFVCLERRL